MLTRYNIEETKTLGLMHLELSVTYKQTASGKVFRRISPDADHTKDSIWPGESNTTFFNIIRN